MGSVERILNGNDNIPTRATTGSAGYDFKSPDTYELVPGEWTVIDTGITLESMGYDRSCINLFMMLAPRSSLGFKYGFRFANTVGIIDSDYPDTIKASVTVDKPYTLVKGERFMQGIFMPFYVLPSEIKPTKSRTGGIGSTGQ